MPVSGRLFHSLCFVMNYDVIDAGGAEGEAVVWMEGDGFQLGAVDFGGGGGWGGGGEGGEVFVDALAGVFDVAFFGGPDVEKVTVGAASEVFVFLGVEKSGRISVLFFLWCGAGVSRPTSVGAMAQAQYSPLWLMGKWSQGQSGK